MAGESGTTPVLVYLSGSRRGEARALSGDEIRIGTGLSMDVRIPADTEPLPAPHHASLRRRGASYELVVEPGREVWVNGERVDRLVLASGDVLELGRDGAVLRFRLYPPGASHRSAAEVFSDCVECARQGSDSAAGRTGLLLASLPKGLATQTSRFFRAAVVLVLVGLAASTWTLTRRSAELEARLADLSGEGASGLVDLAGRKAVSAEELTELLDELGAGIASATERLEAIEGRVGAIGRVVAEAAGATIFLQGAYGFRDPDSGRWVRLVLGPDGRPAPSEKGPPLLTVEGDGPVLELFYTGTGFVASPDGLIFTNRHVAFPWETEASAQALIARGLEPGIRSFLGYLPGETEPFDVSAVAGSEEADLAVLRCRGITAGVRFLELAEVVPEPGDEIVVLGYPLGIRAFMARADRALLEQLRAEGGADFWEVARRLAASGYITPLATRGIVGQRTDRFIVYDAETTSGGSGGPVLGLDGRVVAVNAAILPEFGGSNLGVPAAQARALLGRVRFEGSGGEAQNRGSPP